MCITSLRIQTRSRELTSQWSPLTRQVLVFREDLPLWGFSLHFQPHHTDAYFNLPFFCYLSKSWKIDFHAVLFYSFNIKCVYFSKWPKGDLIWWHWCFQCEAAQRNKPFSIQLWFKTDTGSAPQRGAENRNVLSKVACPNALIFKKRRAFPLKLFSDLFGRCVFWFFFLPQSPHLSLGLSYFYPFLCYVCCTRHACLHTQCGKDKRERRETTSQNFFFP